MADAYKLKGDASFPSVVRTAVNIDGVEIDETAGRNYAAGGYVLASNMTQRDRERAENGDLDHLLEPVSLEEAEEALSLVERQLFIPEHEAESVALIEAGHEIVPKDQVLELKSAGAEEARDALEAAKSDGRDERPNLTLAEFPSLAEVGRDNEGGTNNVPKESEHVSEERLRDAPSSSARRGVEQPPGIPVGESKAASENPEGKKRGRPRKQESSKPDAPKQENKG